MLGIKEYVWRTEATIVLDWACYSLSALMILYLLVRHALLMKGKLKPDELECGDCTKAACVSVKQLCLNSPVNVPRTLRQISTTRSTRTISSTVGSSSNLGIGSRKKIPPVIYYCTFACLFFYVCFTTERSICYLAKGTLGWLPLSYCYYAIAVASDLYLISKSFMYLVFVGRLQQGFKGSIYALSDRFIHALYATVAAYSVGICGTFTAFARGHVEEVSKDVSYCEPRIWESMLMAILTFDLVFVSLVVYLFANSLSKMYKDFAGNNSDEDSRERFKEENAEMLLLPLKYTILSTVAVVSTITSMALLAFASTEFIIPFDCALNCSSLVLMTGPWTPVYNWLCAPLLGCVLRTTWLPCTDLNEAHLSTVMNRGTPKTSLKPSRSRDPESGISDAKSLPPESVIESQVSQISEFQVEV